MYLMCKLSLTRLCTQTKARAGGSAAASAAMGARGGARAACISLENGSGQHEGRFRCGGTLSGTPAWAGLCVDALRCAMLVHAYQASRCKPTACTLFTTCKAASIAAAA